MRNLRKDIRDYKYHQGIWITTLYIYERDDSLLKTSKWEWISHLTNNPKKFIMVSNIFSAQNKRHKIKYIYGAKVTWNIREVIQFDRDNGNTLCKDEIGK